ncbi:MAG: prephenate dehydratase [Coriobacteriales bacterium]
MTRKPTYAFLGPAGTWTDQAVRSFVQSGQLEPDYEELACENMGDVFEAVDRGQADYGVVPIENSLEGPVTTTLDAFAFTSRAEILGECVLDIHQALILAPGAELGDVTTIASHPQGVGQCRRWLRKHLPDAQVKVASSTAAAAEMVSADKTIAAIANPLAAELSGGVVYEEAIEDHLSSQTRFVLIGNGVPSKEGPGKTTLALFLKADRAGELNMILSEFAYAGVNMTLIQSRPTKRELGDYMFFVEIEGYADDANVRVALDCLRLKLRQVKVIGSYPRA